MVVDEFWVRRSVELLYVRVVVDDNGNVTNEPVPGRTYLETGAISDYPSNNRIYNVGDTITSYCNFITFTRFTVVASNARPYVTINTALNQPSCGYLTPLPTPAVPPNPFGTAVYGLYRTFEFCDFNGVENIVNIECMNYEGDVFPIDLGDAQPVKIIEKENEDLFEPIRSKELELGFISAENFELEQLYTGDERKFRVEWIRDGITEFKGFIIPDSCQEPFDANPYPVNIRCTDSIGGLKAVTYPLPIGGDGLLRQTFKDILCYCLAMTNVNLPLRTINNQYAQTMPTGIDDDPTAMTDVNPLRFANDNGTIMTCYEVLTEVCKAWGATLVQSKGEWVFQRVSECSNLTKRSRVYDNKGLFLYSEILSGIRVAGYILE